MKYSVMKKWVKALRSGEYKQSKNYLNDEFGYCCLGVLCEVENIKYGKNTKILNNLALKKTGIKSRIGSFTSRDGGFCLTELNDDGKTFKYIADVIEKNWDKL